MKRMVRDMATKDESFIRLAFGLKNRKGEEVTGPVLTALPKTFKTKATGYFVSDKIDFGDGARYQVSVNIVKIGSRPAAPAAKKKARAKKKRR